MIKGPTDLPAIKPVTCTYLSSPDRIEPARPP